MAHDEIEPVQVILERYSFDPFGLRARMSLEEESGYTSIVPSENEKWEIEGSSEYQSQKDAAIGMALELGIPFMQINQDVIDLLRTEGRVTTKSEVNRAATAKLFNELQDTLGAIRVLSYLWKMTNRK